MAQVLERVPAQEPEWVPVPVPVLAREKVQVQVQAPERASPTPEAVPANCCRRHRIHRRH